MRNKIVVAKKGYSAETDKDPNHLNFSSDYNTLKYDIKGTAQLTITLPANYVGQVKQEETTIAHNLGYVPFFNVIAKVPGSGIFGSSGNFYYQVPIYYDSNYTGQFPNIYEVEAYADAANLYLRFRRNGSPLVDTDYTVTFAYRIFKNNLNF